MAEVAIYTVSNNALELKVEENTETCKLCLMEIPVSDMYTLWHCHCQYCTLCMRQYLTVMITEGNVLSISCPDGQCLHLGLLHAREIEMLVDAATFRRYKRIKFLREVESDPKKVFCPQVGCETVCYVCSASIDGPSTPRPTGIRCPRCLFLFCSVCKNNWHLGLTCDEAMRSSGREGEGIPFTSEENADIKRCPLCHIPIERNDGCAQMMCKQCKHVFCWYCLASLDDDFLLRHYDKGPCKNKLGHSRASIIWHRTQVVGIFAGLGILLLVVSPFLLIAAPCILCCKCKACKACYCEEDGEIDIFTSS